MTADGYQMHPMFREAIVPITRNGIPMRIGFRRRLILSNPEAVQAISRPMMIRMLEVLRISVMPIPGSSIIPGAAASLI